MPALHITAVQSSRRKPGDVSGPWHVVAGMSRRSQIPSLRFAPIAIVRRHLRENGDAYKRAQNRLHRGPSGLPMGNGQETRRSPVTLVLMEELLPTRAGVGNDSTLPARAPAT